MEESPILSELVVRDKQRKEFLKLKFWNVRG